MKKTNKILAGILSAVVLMSPATTWAGPSITDKVVVVEDSVGKYIVTDKIEEDEVFTTLETEDKEMADLIKEVNEGTKDMKAFTEKLYILSAKNRFFPLSKTSAGYAEILNMLKPYIQRKPSGL